MKKGLIRLDMDGICGGRFCPGGLRGTGAYICEGEGVNLEVEVCFKMSSLQLLLSDGL